MKKVYPPNGQPTSFSHNGEQISVPAEGVSLPDSIADIMIGSHGFAGDENKPAIVGTAAVAVDGLPVTAVAISREVIAGAFAALGVSIDPASPATVFEAALAEVTKDIADHIAGEGDRVAAAVKATEQQVLEHLANKADAAKPQGDAAGGEQKPEEPAQQ